MRKLNAGHLRRFEGIKLLISTANLNAGDGAGTAQASATTSASAITYGA
jgi:hypothetical protein